MLNLVIGQRIKVVGNSSEYNVFLHKRKSYGDVYVYVYTSQKIYDSFIQNPNKIPNHFTGFCFYSQIGTN